MSNSEELARKERRRQIIERLNEKEKMFFGSERSTQRAQMTEEELEAEIEKERALCPPP